MKQRISVMGQWASVLFAVHGATACTLQTKTEEPPKGGGNTTTAAGADGGGPSGGGPTTAPTDGGASKKEPASRSAADDEAFTQAIIEGVNGACGSKLTGRITSATLSVTYCGNLVDGLRAVCDDNPGRKDLLQKYTSILCGDTGGPTAATMDWGTALSIDINETMSDPSERVRCVAAKQLGAVYKGDLDANCLERKF